MLSSVQPGAMRLAGSSAGTSVVERRTCSRARASCAGSSASSGDRRSLAATAFYFPGGEHGQEISLTSTASRAHLLGLRQVLPGGVAGLRQWLRPHHAPGRNARRGLVPVRRLGYRATERAAEGEG